MTQNGTNRTPILDLDDLLEPQAAITVQGEHYEFVRWASLGLLERKRLQKAFDRIRELEADDDLTEDAQAEHAQLIRDTLTRVTNIPAEIIDALDEERRENAVSFFLALRLLRISERQTGMASSLTNATGENSSAVSTPAGPKRARKSGS